MASFEGLADRQPASHEGGGGNALYLVNHEDFCVYGPSEANTPIAHAGDNVVSWCTKVRRYPCSFRERAANV